MIKRNLFKQYWNSSSGSFANIFAISLLPLLLSAGIAVDYSVARKQRGTLQHAIDAAALAAGTEENKSEEERIQLGKDMFEALTVNFGAELTPSFTVSTDTISASVDYNSQTSFGGLIGINEIGISVATEIKYAVESAAEVSLVLDYSGSMGWNGKWQAMRDAAKELIDVLGENGTKTDIKFALAPFSRLVYTSLPSDYVVGQIAGNNWTGCTQDRKWPYNIDDVTPSPGDDDTKWGLTPSANTHHCNSQINRNLIVRPLDDDHAAVKNQLDIMTPGGATHIALGLEFGWHLISPNEPFSEGVAYGTNGTKKFIVLLTDGQQTVKAWGANDSYKVSNGEENLEDMCQAIKTENIYMVTIAFDLDDGATKDRLRNCATNNGYFFDADSNTELATAFDTVAALIKGSLHVSK